MSTCDAAFCSSPSGGGEFPEASEEGLRGTEPCGYKAICCYCDKLHLQPVQVMQLNERLCITVAPILSVERVLIVIIVFSI